jgi:NAD(P)-dependent dehydrogenase (short-subunit alcohol dehydrogenase family)
LSLDLTSAEIFSVKGKTAVLTGASGFLGRTFAKTLLANGARVVTIGRSVRLEAEAKTWAAEFGEDRVRCCRVDMYDAAEFERVLDEIATSERNIDIVINNAHELGSGTGFNVPEGTLEHSTPEQWMKNLTGGVYWAVQTTQKLGAVMKTQGCGSIVNISTMYALVAPRPQLYAGTEFVNPPGYSASKAALLSFTRYTASFWGSYGVRANAILPGPFSNTEDVGENAVAPDSPFLKRLKGNTCLGRVGKPHELSGALLFLASDASSFMTGQAIVVDGGWTAV